MVVGLSVCIVGSMVHVREGACTQRQEKNLIQTQVSMLAELLSTQLSPHTLTILAAVKTKIGSNAQVYTIFSDLRDAQGIILV